MPRLSSPRTSSLTLIEDWKRTRCGPGYHCPLPTAHYEAPAMSDSPQIQRPSSDLGLLSRRHMLCRIGGGFGALGLASVMADAGVLTGLARAEGPSEAAVPVDPMAPRPPHFPARAKRVIFLFMNGGPSHINTFAPKPMIAKYAGQRPKAIASDAQRPN